MPVLRDDFTAGSVILVTGSTDGIGKETARVLAERGARVIIHGKNEDKTYRVRDEIASIAKVPPESVVADFRVLDEVQRMGEEVATRFPSLRVLVNNAGVYNKEKQMTPDGYESTFQIHYLAHFLLTHLLLDRLMHNATARIVNCTSRLHEEAEYGFENLLQSFTAENGYDPDNAYSNAKLALTMFNMEFADRIRGSGVTMNCVHPGAVDTKLLRAGYGTAKEAVPPAIGAKYLVNLVVNPTFEHLTGAYFNRMDHEQADKRVYDRQLRQKLWQYSQHILKHKGFLKQVA
jgi:NAD(P)-dependent dehydrogenase (short-subunit alcohol dehydrogenase family)